MEEIKTVNYKGKEIISIDYSKCGDDQQKVIAIATEAAAIMAKMPLNSALVLVNVKNFTFNSDIIQEFKENLEGFFLRQAVKTLPIVSAASFQMAGVSKV